MKFRSLVLIAISFFAFPGSLTGASAAWNSLYREGMQAQMQGRHEEALAKLQQALKELDPHEKNDLISAADTHVQLAHVYVSMKQVDEAEQEFLEALKLREKFGGGERSNAAVDAMEQLIRFYRMQNRPSDALPYQEKLLAFWKKLAGANSVKYAMTLREQADVLASLTRYDEAEAQYRQAIEILNKAAGVDQPVVALTNAALGRMFLRKGDLASAILAFQQAVNNVNPEFLLGSATGRALMQELAATLRRDQRVDEAAQVEARLKSHTVVAQMAGRNGTTQPSIVYKTEPQYTEKARKARLMGTVQLALEVDETGAPVNIFVVQPLGMGLDENAVETVRTWKFRPATQDGKPVRVIANLEVNFRLL